MRCEDILKDYNERYKERDMTYIEQVVAEMARRVIALENQIKNMRGHDE